MNTSNATYYNQAYNYNCNRAPIFVQIRQKKNKQTERKQNAGRNWKQSAKYIIYA